jgi:hypothetical protein
MLSIAACGWSGDSLAPPSVTLSSVAASVESSSEGRWSEAVEIVGIDVGMGALGTEAGDDGPPAPGSRRGDTTGRVVAPVSSLTAADPAAEAGGGTSRGSSGRSRGVRSSGLLP